MHFLSLLSLYPPPSFLTAHLVHFLSNVGIDWLFRVVFADDFSSYMVYDSDCMLVLPKLLYVLNIFILIPHVHLLQIR